MKKKGNKCGIDAHGLAMSKETQKRREGKGNKAEPTITEEILSDLIWQESSF